jgi:hypothetical protein
MCHPKIYTSPLDQVVQRKVKDGLQGYSRPLRHLVKQKVSPETHPINYNFKKGKREWSAKYFCSSAQKLHHPSLYQPNGGYLKNSNSPTLEHTKEKII